MHIFNLGNKNDKKNVPNAVQKTLKMMAINEGRNGIAVMIASMFFRTKEETQRPRKSSGVIGLTINKHI